MLFRGYVLGEGQRTIKQFELFFHEQIRFPIRHAFNYEILNLHSLVSKRKIKTREVHVRKSWTSFEAVGATGKKLQAEASLSTMTTRSQFSGDDFLSKPEMLLVGRL